MDYPWRVKQRQADEHIGRFAAASDEYIRSANLELRYDRDPDAGVIGVRLHADADPPMALGATIGDVLHNLRSALDSLAWETCQRAGVTSSQEKVIYFPIGTDPKRWPELARSQLPNVSADHLEVFKRLQPWYWDEQARQRGIEVPGSTAHRHPLARLHDLAKVDRHRLTLPVLAREGHTWLGCEEGVTAEILRAESPTRGDVFLEWRVTPARAAASVHPGGEVLLCLSEESARLKRTSISELRRMHQEVVQATRTVEVEVLEVVTSDDLSGLRELERVWQNAENELYSLMQSDRSVDTAYIDAYHRASQAEEQAKAAYGRRWNELFG